MKGAKDISFLFLLADLGRQMRLLIDQALRNELDIGGTQFSILHHLTEHEGISQREMADLLEIEGSSLLRHVDALERRGLIRRRIDSADRRLNQLFLTPAAGDIIEKAQEICAGVREKLMAGFTRAETDTIYGYLRRLRFQAGASTDDKKDKRKWAKA